MHRKLLTSTSILILFAGLALGGTTNGTTNVDSKKSINPKFRLNNNTICENLLSAFFVSDNTDVSTDATTVVNNVTEADCLNFCSDNRDQRGRFIFCASVAYDQEQKECKIYKQSSFPDGILEHRAVNGKRYFEKFCLADDLPADCANKQFVRVNNYILKGYAQSTATVSTMAECVAQCVREKEFECKSAMYFYEEGECITNLESAITRPDEFQKPDDEDKVIFFHNGCINQLPEASPNNKFEHVEISASEDESTPPIIKEDEKMHSTIAQTTTTKAPESSHTSTNPETTTTVETTTKEKTTEIPTQSSTTTVEPTTTERLAILKTKTEEKTTIVEEQTKPIAKATDETFRNEMKNTDMLPEENTAKIPKENEKILVERKEEIREEQKEKAIEEQEKKKMEQLEIKLERIEGNIQEQKASKVEEATQKSLKKVIETPKLYTAKYLEKTNDGFNKSPESVEEQPAQMVSSDTSNSENSIRKAPEAKMPEMLLKNVELTEDKPNLNLNLFKRPKFLSSSFTKHLQLKSLKTSKETGETETWSEDGFFGNWGAWTPCKQAGERRIRRRKCMDLRRCKGPLTQVDYCPNVLPVANPEESEKTESTDQEGPTAPPTRNPLPVFVDNPSLSNSKGAPPSILPPQLPRKELKPLPVGAPGRPEDIWSPWLGTCNNFASAQACTNNQVIGFESRECIAKNPKLCKGPFFRYCTLPC